MNTVVWHIQRFFQILGIPDAFLPLCSYVVLLGATWGVYLGIVKWRWATGRLDRKGAAFWTFVSPWLLGFVIFTVGPMLFSVYASFTRWDILNPPEWIGFKNYADAVADDRMYKALKVTFTFALMSVPMGLVTSFLIALLMNTRVRGMMLFRTMWYLPSLIGGVPQILLFAALFNPDRGVINKFLGLFGVNGPDWFLSQTWAIPTLAIVGLWGAGGGMMIYLAALQDVPRSLYEAVELDGGGLIRKWWTVTVPQLSPILFFNFLTGLIGAMQVFTPGLVLGGGNAGSGDRLLFFVLYVYNSAFLDFKMGYASALSWILFFIVLGMTALTFRSSGSLVYYESEARKALKSRTARTPRRRLQDGAAVAVG